MLRWLPLGLPAWAAGVLVLLAPAARGAPVDPDSTASVITVLPNGLRVVVATVPDARLAEVRVFQAITAAHEPPGKEGIAHLVEHLAFEGRGAAPDRRVARSLSLLSCYANASTGPWGVEYETECLPSLLPQVLAIEAGRLTQLAVSRETFAREKQVVREELAMRARMSASSDLLEELFRAAYAGGPYGAERGGSDSTVAALTLEDARAFHAAANDPRTMVLSIETSQPAQGVLEPVRAAFGSLVPRGDVVPLPPVGAVAGPRTSPVLDRYDATGLWAAIGFRLPRASASEKLMASMLEELLHRQKLACGITPVPGEAFLHVGMRLRYMAPPEGADPAAYEPEELGRYAWGRLWKEVQEAADAGLRAKEFGALKEWAARGVGGKGGPRNATGLTLVRDLLAGDDLRWLVDSDSLVAALDLASFTAYVRTGIRQVTVKGVAHGRDSGRALPLQLADRMLHERIADPVDVATSQLTAPAIQPVLEAYRQSRRRQIEHTTLSNGIPLLLVPIASELEACVGGVRTFSPPKWAQRGEQPGIPLLYPSVVAFEPAYFEEGPRQLPFFARFLVSPVRFQFDAQGSANRVDEIANTLAQRLAQRELSVQRWTFELRHAATTLDLQHRPPSSQASWSRFAGLLGSEHPLLGTWAADPRSIGKLTYDRLRGAHAWLTRTGNLRLLVAGGVESGAARAAMEAAFGTRPGPDTENPPVPITAALQGVVGRVVPAFDRRDCAIVLSMPPVTWAGPQGWDWAERALVRQLVRDRIRRRLREQEGLSYWVWVNEEVAGASSMLQVGLSTFCESAGAALTLTREELRSLAARPPTADELARARLKLAGSVARQLESTNGAFEFLDEAARTGPVPADPVLAVLDADPARIAGLLLQSIQPDRFAFSVEGPILEDAIEEFLPRP